MREVLKECPEELQLFCKVTKNPGLQENMSSQEFFQLLEQLATILDPPSSKISAAILICQSINNNDCPLTDEYLARRRRVHFSEFSAS